MAVLLSLFASAVWSLNPVLLVRALRREPAVGVHAFRILSIAVALFPWFLWTRRIPTEPATWALIAGAALSGPVLAWFLYILALERLPISVAHPIVNSYALFAILFEILIWGIVPPPVAWGGVLLILLGIFLFREETREGGKRVTLTGMICGLGTSFFWGLASVFFKALVGRVDIYTLLFFRSLLATLVLSPFLLRFPLRTREGRIFAALSGVLNDVVGLWLYLTAMKGAPLYIVVPLSSLSPVLAYFWAHAWFHEPFKTRRWLAILAIVVGTVLLSRS